MKVSKEGLRRIVREAVRVKLEEAPIHGELPTSDDDREKTAYLADELANHLLMVGELKWYDQVIAIADACRSGHRKPKDR